jgi:plastocyanin
MSRTGWIWAAVIVVLLVIGAIFLMKPAAPATTTTGNTVTTTDQTTPGTNTSSDTTLGGSVDATVNTGATGGKTVTVNYNGTSFSPASITVAKGDTVNFVMSGGSGMWLASNPHPSHTGYDGTSRATHCAPGYTGAKPFDECSMGTSFAFTFDKTGTFGYHDHMNESAHGTVVVQ